MYSRFALAKKYLQYYLTASNGKGHGVHSPFVYEFIRNVLNDGRHYGAYDIVEGLRARLLGDRAVVEVKDLGAGSVSSGGMGGVSRDRVSSDGGTSGGRISERRICDIARNAAKPRKLGQLLFRIARYYKAGRVLELGTSMGLSTAYLAQGAGESGGYVWTIEGAPAVAAVAEKNLLSVGSENVAVVVGNFDDRLPEVLDSAGGFDLAFVDGNHRLEPTLRYFHMLMSRAPGACMLIFDDIHWSKEMEEAWDSIRQDPRVYMTIDLFFIGLVVLRDEFRVKQDFVIRY